MPLTRGRLLDRVERQADAGITGGVGVGLETHPVQFAQHVDQFAARIAGPAPHPGSVGVVLQHQCGMRFDDVVGVELDRAEPEHRMIGSLVDRVAKSLPEGAVGAHRMEQRRDHPDVSTPSASARSNSGSSASGTCGSTTVVMPSAVAMRMLDRSLR